MAINDRIGQLRQERRWTQRELGETVVVHQKQVTVYARGAKVPSIEVLIKLAEAF